MKIEDILAQERRARMAAERLLAQKQKELSDANRVLSKQTNSLSDEIIENRETLEEIKGQNTLVRADLERANKEMVIAKRRLWDSLETIEDGFAVFDQANHMIAANSAYLKPFDGLSCVRPGVSYAEILTVATEEGIVDIGDLRPLEWRDMMLERWNAPKRDPLLIRLWDGTYVRFVDRRSRDGDMVSLALNTTETIKYQKELKDARHRAEAASRAKSTFLANMSHEIRTPMNGIVSMAELMLEQSLSEEQQLYVNTIRQSGEALLTIINDVLDYSKIEAAKLTLRPEPFDLEKVIFEVVTLLKPFVREKGLEISVDFDMFMPSKFEGDQMRIRQILTNLIGNAVKFTDTGHVLIRAIGLPSTDDATQRIHITVEDSGIGISQDMQSHIFGEFNQVEDKNNRQYEGTGLGLAITRELVELMGGKIWVESEEGRGSCFGFHVTLPVLETLTPPHFDSSPGLALVAMSDSVHRANLEKRLFALGFDVETTTSWNAVKLAAPAARIAFVEDQFCILGQNEDNCGWIARLKTVNKNLPVHILSAQTGPQPGCVGHELATSSLTLPILRSTLFKVLEALKTTVPTIATIGAPPDEDTIQSRQMRILTADDNKTNRLVFSKMVKDLDIDLHVVSDGHEVVESFLEIKPDLIFMDISMPRVDGKEATLQIRKLEADQDLPHTPIIALTAHALEGDAEEIMTYGLDQHMTKPLRKADLLAAIEKHQPEDARDPVSSD